MWLTPRQTELMRPGTFSHCMTSERSSTVERITMILRFPLVSENQLDISQTIGQTSLDPIEQMWKIQSCLRLFRPPACGLQLPGPSCAFHHHFAHPTCFPH